MTLGRRAFAARQKRTMERRESVRVLIRFLVCLRIGLFQEGMHKT
jgi:hypothetical protein